MQQHCIRSRPNEAHLNTAGDSDVEGHSLRDRQELACRDSGELSVGLENGAVGNAVANLDSLHCQGKQVCFGFMSAIGWRYSSKPADNPSS